jgi:hypothetical protein
MPPWLIAKVPSTVKAWEVAAWAGHTAESVVSRWRNHRDARDLYLPQELDISLLEQEGSLSLACQPVEPSLRGQALQAARKQQIEAIHDVNCVPLARLPKWLDDAAKSSLGVKDAQRIERLIEAMLRGNSAYQLEQSVEAAIRGLNGIMLALHPDRASHLFMDKEDARLKRQASDLLSLVTQSRAILQNSSQLQSLFRQRKYTPANIPSHPG